MVHPQRCKIWRKEERGIEGAKLRRSKNLAHRASGILGTMYSKRRGSIDNADERGVGYMRAEHLP